MRLRIAVAAIGVGLAWAAPAQAQSTPYAPWDGSNPFNCTLHDAGTGPVPNVPDDPFCVEFDKNSQSVVPDLGLVDFLVNEPGRVAAAAPKCFYYQSDHWTGALVQGQPPELWHWDGQYFFDKAIGAGGVNLQNFRVLGQPASPAAYGPVPTAFAPYLDQGGGGAYVVGNIPADPACAARVDTQGERDQVYAGGQPPPAPPRQYDPTLPCALENAIVGSSSADELIGGPGGDVLVGLGGNDLLVGAEAGDCLSGQRGADRLRGGSGRDQLKGGRGNDFLKGGPGRDLLRCGRGLDRAVVKGRDRVRGCELVKR
jgi:hypothetical protein